MWPKSRPHVLSESAAVANSLRCHQSSPGCGSVGCDVGWVVAPLALRWNSMYLRTGSSCLPSCLDSLFETELKYAMIELNSSSLAGKLGIRIPVNSSGRSGSTFLKKLKSQLN